MSALELLLFTVDTALARRATAAGVDGIIIDWEYRGKRERQRGADTQVNCDTPEDLRRVRAAIQARIIVRISQYGPATAREAEQAIDGGADELLLPMVETPDDVWRTLDCVRNRVPLGILIETVSAVEQAQSLGQLPLRRVFLGLNDLSIQRRTGNIFLPLVDGTLDTVRQAIRVPFGFGGLTLPEAGSPIPCRLLMAEMARLATDFTFLRRSFLRDTAGGDLTTSVSRIRQALAVARLRRPASIAADHAALRQAVLAQVQESASEVIGVPVSSAHDAARRRLIA